jgi:hypothetical protein
MPPAMAETSVASLFSKVKETSILMSVIQAFLKFITAETSKSDRGRPSLPYIIPTVQLMILWSDLTGRSVVTPKRKTRGAKKSGESEQPSTEFVRLCLSMIDPKVSLSNAETSIKKALPILRRAWKFRAEHPDLNPNDPFDYFWLALADFEGAQIIPKKRTV